MKSLDINTMKGLANKAEILDLMSDEWVEVAEGIFDDENFSKQNNSKITKAVENWIQLEQRIALKISEEFGEKISFNKSEDERIERGIKELTENSRLLSEFNFSNMSSSLNTSLDLQSRRLFCNVELTLPPIPKSESNDTELQLNFVKEQLDVCKQNDKAAFTKIEPNLYLIIKRKREQTNLTGRLIDFGQLLEESLGSEISSVQISYQVDLGIITTKSKIFVSEYEEYIRNFYKNIIRCLESYL